VKLSRKVHPAFLTALAVTTLLAVLVPTGMQVAQARTQQAVERMQNIAARIQDPPNVHYLSRGDCPDQTYLVRCMKSPDEPERLGDQMLTALTAVAGRHRPALRCDTDLRHTGISSCLVRIDDGPHAVLISINLDGHMVTGKFVITGSQIRIDAT
jgi:hypothetical protein